MELTKSQQLLYTLIREMGMVEDKTKLAKLEHYVDFIHYAFHDKPVSEENYLYQRRKQGPLAMHFNYDLEVLKKAGLVEEKPSYNYKPKKEIVIKWSKDEKKTINFVIKKYGGYSYRDLVSLSHKQMPYLSAKDGGIIEYFTAYNLVEEYPDYEN